MANKVILFGAMAYNKFRVNPKQERTYKGVVYDSKKEMGYFQKLELLGGAVNASERVVEIHRQVVFDFILDDIKICDYICDFIVTYADGKI